MKINNVHAFLLSYVFPEPLRLPFYGGERTILKRDAMLIRVEADNGLVGYAPGPGSEAAARGIERTIKPFLEGRTLVDPDALRVQFLEAFPGDLQISPHPFDRPQGHMDVVVQESHLAPKTLLRCRGQGAPHRLQTPGVP